MGVGHFWLRRRGDDFVDEAQRPEGAHRRARERVLRRVKEWLAVSQPRRAPGWMLDATNRIGI
jgi:hypothetical protein